MVKGNTTNYFVGLITIIASMQVISWVLSQYTDIAPLNFGWAILMLTAIAGIITLFVLGKKIGTLNQKDIIFIILETAGVVAVFYFLPKYVPEIFSSLNIG